MNNKLKSHGQSVRRVVLPSGRSIEVVQFRDTHDPPQGLHVCPDCVSELVQPVAWNATSHERWELTLECPNCWWTVGGTFDRDEVNQLEERLDDGLSEMLADLKRLAHANMADQVDRFAAALHADLILPEDF